MFIAVALMCHSLDIRDCTMQIAQQVFITEEACVAFRDSEMFAQYPDGTIVGASCFKIPGEEA